MKNIFLLLLSSTVLLTACNKNGTPKPDHSGMFIKFFGGAKYDTGYSVKESGDGGFVIVGSMIGVERSDKNCYIVKTDADGNKLWEQNFGVDLYDEEATDVHVDGQGNYLVAGYSKNSKDSSDFLLLKYSKDGLLMHTATYGLANRNEMAQFISVTADGGILLAGSRQQANSTQLNMFVVKVSMDTITWQKDLGLNALYDQIGTIVELPNSNLLWCGTVNRNAETDLRITMTDAHSNLKWDLSIGEGDGKSQSGKQIQLTTDGNFIVGGTELSGEGSMPLLAKINAFGTLLWQTQPGGLGGAVNSVYPTSDGGYILAGEKDSDYLLMQTDASGALTWEKNYGGKGIDRASRVIQSGDGFLVIGTVFVSNNTLMGLIKTDNKGEASKQ